MIRPERIAGSMTVEAALVLPLFLFFFLNLGSVMEVLRLHGKLETALWELGREMGVYGSALKLKALWGDDGEEPGNASEAPGLQRAAPEDTGDTGNGLGGLKKAAESLLWGSSFSGIGNVLLSYTYVKAGIGNFLGEAYLESAPIRGGPDGLYFPGTDLSNEDDVLEIIVSYQIEPFFPLAAFRPFYMENRYYGRLWTGYDVEKGALAVYYLTDNEEVFHTDRDCTHLFLSVRQISWLALATEVNGSGRPYRMCEKCAHGLRPQDVWVAREGDCFHAKRDCSGLKRTYRAVTWEEAKNYRPCSRCGYKKREEP